MKLHIRPANSQDGDAIIHFNASMAMETENKELNFDILRDGVSRVLSDPTKGFYLVAESEEKVVGQLMITYEWSDWRNADFWWIQSVYVLPDYRGSGVFKALYRHVAIEAKKSNACGLRLYVDQSNVRAQDTYRSLGMSASHYQFFETEFQSSNH